MTTSTISFAEVGTLLFEGILIFLLVTGGTIFFLENRKHHQQEIETKFHD